jgi:hypothetical protein
MGSFLFGFVAGSNLTWIFMELRRDARRGSNPPPPGRKPPAPPPAPGMRREWLWSPSQMAECGGPCWEAQDPRHCDCGALWRDVPTTPNPPIKPKPQGGRQIDPLP